MWAALPGYDNKTFRSKDVDGDDKSELESSDQVLRTAQRIAKRLRKRASLVERSSEAENGNEEMGLGQALTPRGSPSGLKWEQAGISKPVDGMELINKKLAEALKTKTEFSQKEWEEFGVHPLL
eukprot:4312850-Prymnesium_polylepis.1